MTIKGGIIDRFNWSWNSDQYGLIYEPIQTGVGIMTDRETLIYILGMLDALEDKHMTWEDQELIHKAVRAAVYGGRVITIRDENDLIEGWEKENGT